MVGFGVVRWACGEVRVIGGILGVYRQALTEGDPADDRVPICPVGVVGSVSGRCRRRSGPRLESGSCRKS